MSLVIHKKNDKNKQWLPEGDRSVLQGCGVVPLLLSHGHYPICEALDGEFPHGLSLPSATIPAPEPCSCSSQPGRMVGNATSEAFQPLGKTLWGLGKVQTSVVLGGVCIFSW